MVAVTQPNCSYITCIFRDKDTARFLMGAAIQMDGKDLGVHNIGTIYQMVIKLIKIDSKTMIHISKTLANM